VNEKPLYSPNFGSNWDFLNLNQYFQKIPIKLKKITDNRIKNFVTSKPKDQTN
jgi:hypothetical protein